MIDRQSVQNFFRWAEIEKDGLIELNHFYFQDGKYRRVETGWAKEYSDTLLPDLTKPYLVTVGINPRPQFETKFDCAKDKDIEVYKNIYLDIEPIHAPNTTVSEEDLERCAEFCDTVFPGDEQYIDGSPVVAKSGNGFHILYGIPPYNNPQEFGNKLQTWYKTKLLPNTEKLRKHYNVRIDSTFSPCRQLKLYGTKKPIEGSRLSSFPNVARIEDANFRDYILSFREKATAKVTVGLSLRGTREDLTLEAIEERYGLTR